LPDEATWICLALPDPCPELTTLRELPCPSEFPWDPRRDVSSLTFVREAQAYTGLVTPFAEQLRLGLHDAERMTVAQRDGDRHDRSKLHPIRETGDDVATTTRRSYRSQPGDHATQHAAGSNHSSEATA
jgi:hypothetical protein